MQYTDIKNFYNIKQQFTCVNPQEFNLNMSHGVECLLCQMSAYASLGVIFITLLSVQGKDKIFQDHAIVNHYK